MKPARIILHCSLAERLLGELKDATRGGALRTAMGKIASDPYSAGRILRGLKLPSRVGQVWKLWVGGRRGRRLIYYVPQDQQDAPFIAVIPLFLSEGRRGQFDWSEIDPNEVGQEVVDDFAAKRYDRFKALTI